MARNSEKAMTTLARWRAAHIETKKDKEIRPYLATECDDLKKAEKFRRHIISEISRKVAQIQNAGMGEFKLRDLNDDINKLMREKGHWEDRIKDLGGPDYRKIGPKMLDYEGKEIPGNRGYRYFGAAKDLPGVKELFEQIVPPPYKKSRGELMKDINADYYGYRDEDDGLLVAMEMQKEKETINELLKNGRRNSLVNSNVDNIYTNNSSGDETEPIGKDNVSNNEAITIPITHINIPTQKEIEKALVERKKMELLQRYASDTLTQGQEEIKQILEINK